MWIEDLDRVCEIEQRIYPFPWSRGNFADSLIARYHGTVMACESTLMGYAILTAAAGEAHLLNLSIDAPWQGHGHGRALLLNQIDLARGQGARLLLLEVRPSNTVARALYRDTGFEQITVRRGYYPDHGGREDALLLALPL
ncbi:MAG: ribosomal-protein-alanine N-acetyltransferase [Betaproteobacteria bacterium]|nr:ribosomal-protein-alanine N-acetyltransferase [Betaproteobacteria bacterium]